MTTQAADFDPIKFKESTRQQWENVAEAWNRWGPTLQVWLDLATEAMLQMAPTDEEQSSRKRTIVGVRSFYQRRARPARSTSREWVGRD